MVSEPGNDDAAAPDWAAARQRRATADNVTRGALLEAAARVFARKGFAATSVGDVTNEARVSRSAFYAYFRSKHETFLMVAGQVRDDFLHAHELPGNLDPRAMGRASIAAFLTAHAQYSALLTVIEHEAGADSEIDAIWHEMQRRPARRMARYVRDLAAQDQADPVAEPEMLAESMFALFRRFGAELAVDTIDAADPTSRFARRVDELTAVYLRLIGAE
ncbi:TetR/AcrR family transcriptional regulator [Tomitella gaofuii]|uniref:TetR/AcrR family transcriptional regulator n=1 Tax=Tomitella gaofuii TaxID=2760083 RepID=UPI0015FDD284|nr:TetR/AcrR family transcriptional regulator [Tomitella gaofuii]